MSEFLTLYRTAGFTGSRMLPRPDVVRCANIAEVAMNFGLKILVGDAPGCDITVRRAAPLAIVFRHDPNLPKRAALAYRSIQMIDTLARSTAPILIAYPDRPCPEALRPSRRPGDCFNGSGSGTWATVCYALGQGVPVVVWPGFYKVPAPSWSIAEQVKRGSLAGFYRLFVPQPQLLTVAY